MLINSNISHSVPSLYGTNKPSLRWQSRWFLPQDAMWSISVDLKDHQQHNKTPGTIAMRPVMRTHKCVGLGFVQNVTYVAFARQR